MKKIEMSAKQAALALSAVSGKCVIASDLPDLLPDHPQGAPYSPLDLREAHAKLAPMRAALLSAGVGKESGYVPPVVVGHFTKGGVGKTTVFANVGVEMAKHGIKALFIDGDPQATATSLYGVDVDDLTVKTLKDILIGGTPVAEAIRPLYPNAVLDLLPSDITMAKFDMEAYPRSRRETLFKRFIHENAQFFSRYDIILIDTNPAPNLLNQNLMIGADDIVMPVALDAPSLKSMRLMNSELASVDEVDPQDRRFWIVANNYETKTRHGEVSKKQLLESYQAITFGTIIPADAAVSRQGWMNEETGGTLLVENDPSSRAAKRITDLAIEMANKLIWAPFDVEQPLAVAA